MNRVAIIFDNFGPYHIARLSAAADVCDLVAIEVAGRSGTYAWEKVATAAAFRRVTLVEQSTSDEVGGAKIVERLEQALNDAQPAVVVVPGWASVAAYGAMRWCLRRGVPMVVVSESTAWDEPRVAWKEAIKRRLVSLFACALVGGARHRDYLEALALPAERIFLGYDVVNNAYFREQTQAAASKMDAVALKYGLFNHYFLASARFIEKKNLPRLLEAYAAYRKTCATPDPWSLILLGDGALRPALEQQRDALGLRDSVLMPGFRQIEDLPAYYAGAGAFIQPSTIEPWGLVVNEAMASGLPVLVSERCGCAPELIHDGVNGFTFDPYDVDRLAQRMGEISAPDFPREKFREASMAIIAHWGPDRFASGLAQAINAALTTGPARPTAFERALLELLLRR